MRVCFESAHLREGSEEAEEPFVAGEVRLMRCQLSLERINERAAVDRCCPHRPANIEAAAALVAASVDRWAGAGLVLDGVALRQALADRTQVCCVALLLHNITVHTMADGADREWC